MAKEDLTARLGFDMGEFKRGLRDAEKEATRAQRGFGKKAGRAGQFLGGGISAPGLAGAGAVAGGTAAAGLAVEIGRQIRQAMDLRSQAAATGRTVSELGTGVSSQQAAAFSNAGQGLAELTQGLNALSAVITGPLAQLAGSSGADAGRNLDRLSQRMQNFQDRLTGFVQARDPFEIRRERQLGEDAAQSRERAVNQQRASFVREGTRQAISFEVR